MLDNKIGNISIRCIVLFYVFKFHNFMILSGLLLFVFSVDNEADDDTLHFLIFVQ